jgi:hypothetical protein
VDAIIPVVSTLVGVLAGWALSRWNAHDERAYRERQTVRERRVAAAAALDEAVLEAAAAVPKLTSPADQLLEPLARAHGLLRMGWVRSSVLADPGVEHRLRAVDMAIMIADIDCHALGQAGLNPAPITVGFEDLRRALAAFQLGDELPPPKLPPAEELLAISGSAEYGDRFNAIHRELRERERARAERREEPDQA